MDLQWNCYSNIALRQMNIVFYYSQIANEINYSEAKFLKKCIQHRPENTTTTL